MRGLALIGGVFIAIAALGLSRGPALVPKLDLRHEAPRPAATVSVPVVEPPVPDEVASVPVSPATRYASLASEACLAELDARHIEHVRVDRRDVETPVRLAGSLSGVRFRTLVPKRERDRSPYEIFDCRLVLALDDFAKILLRHDIVDVMYYSAFRPLVPGVVKRGHESGLAIDVAFLGRADRSTYSILRDFTPMRTEHPCRPLIRAKGPRELRAVVCEAAAQGLFHVALTPDYNAAHRDHFHLEIVPGEERSLIH